MIYRIYEAESNDVLCPESFCPMKTLDLKLHVTYEAQHDGRSWSREFVNECEEKLIENITEDLKSKVETFIRKTKPYDCHVFE